MILEIKYGSRREAAQAALKWSKQPTVLEQNLRYFWIKCDIFLLVDKLLLLSFYALEFYTLIPIRWHFYKNHATFKDGEKEEDGQEKIIFKRIL